MPISSNVSELGIYNVCRITSCAKASFEIFNIYAYLVMIMAMGHKLLKYQWQPVKMLNIKVVLWIIEVPVALDLIVAYVSVESMKNIWLKAMRPFSDSSWLYKLNDTYIYQ